MPTLAERPSVVLTGHDQYLFREGTHARLYEKLGAHFLGDATHFAVWAPNATSVSVIGDWNGWDPRTNPMQGSDSGIWQVHVPNAKPGCVYKFHIVSRNAGYRVDKADPYAFRAEEPPKTGSMVWDLAYEWHDQAWMQDRKYRNALDAPWSIYEVHLGSWRRDPSNPERQLSYREVAPMLAEYCQKMRFTHVELLPIMEHPFYGSWGYQTTGYFAPSNRYGTPQDFMSFVDTLHQAGVGVILDWVPSHFPWDQHGLGFFDGSHLYEHADPRQGHHPDWASAIFNYGRNEVRSFLASSARFWLDKYHADGLRVDAVASMLYLDYGRKHGEWIPNQFGGRENLEAISFLQFLNQTLFRDFPDTQTIAEESTAWPQVSRPTYLGGLGFGMKWNMGWMHDTLRYMKNDPVHRKYRHDELTFSLWYAFHENFVLPLSHDEVVHGKGSLIGRMPGDAWQQFANLRALFGYMWSHPGKKLLFMGGEFGQRREWAHDTSLEWHVLGMDKRHEGVQQWVADLNRVMREQPALHQKDFSTDGFRWVQRGDWEQSVVSFLRQGNESAPPILVVCNFTPVPRENYRLGVPRGGYWKELLNSDAPLYGGSGLGNYGGCEATPMPYNEYSHSLSITVPPLSVLFFKPE
ncbi:MAG: 1,4-alpha-glucan branching protein GlgB [Betaproteobacteria bacterium]|nr:1,4-alpha-glucan branching protein GlgB [Betaproteobacteria bacterium]MBV9360212.1 1,4-alpha-glucan branching protein GlgB [Betaproteobacteria bacterium]